MTGSAGSKSLAAGMQLLILEAPKKIPIYESFDALTKYRWYLFDKSEDGFKREKI